MGAAAAHLGMLCVWGEGEEARLLDSEGSAIMKRSVSFRADFAAHEFRIRKSARTNMKSLGVHEVRIETRRACKHNTSLSRPLFPIIAVLWYHSFRAVLPQPTSRAWLCPVDYETSRAQVKNQERQKCYWWLSSATRSRTWSGDSRNGI